MFAAAKGANETVAFLLAEGASPDLMNNYNGSALETSIQRKCSSTIDLLALVTTKGLDEALDNLLPRTQSRPLPLKIF